MQDGEEDDDDNIADQAHLYEAGAFEDEPMDDAEEMDEAGENAAEDHYQIFSLFGCNSRNRNQFVS